MKIRNLTKRIFSILLVFGFVFSIAGCKKSSAPESILSTYYVEYEDVVGGGAGDTTDGEDKNTSNSSAGKVNSADKATTSGNVSADKSDSKQVSMLTWWDFSETEKERKEAWEKKNGYTAKLIKTTQGLYSTKLASLVMAGNSPDIAAMNASGFPAFINKSLIIPINDYIDLKDDRLALDVMEAAKYNGKYYGMDVIGSQFTQFFVIYYNKTLMESWGVAETPTDLWNAGNWNWDTFLELAKYMTGTKGGKNITGFSVASGSFWEYWSVSAGTSMVGYTPSSSAFKNNYKNATVIKGWEWANDLLNDHKCAINQGNLTDGNVAMVGGGQWYMWKGDVYDKQMTDEWSVVPWPSPKGQKATLPTQVQLWGLCNGGKNPKKAVDFLYYWLDTDNSKKEVYANNELKAIHKKLWKMDKSYTWAKGPISYSDVNAYDTLMKKLYTCKRSEITQILDSNSPTLDANLKLIDKDKVSLSK